MSFTQNGQCDSSAESSKKRKLMDDPNCNSNPSSSTYSFTTSPVKKKVKKWSPEHILKNESIRRVMAQSQYDIVSQGVAAINAGKDPNHVPCYKKKVFGRSPSKEDPYALPISAEKPRKLIRAKATSNLFETVAKKEVATDVTPEMVKDKTLRRPPSSPHPGRDNFNRKKSTPEGKQPLIPPVLCGLDDDIPSVSFNSLISPGSRLGPSSRSCINLLRTVAPTSTPVRTPTSRGLRTSGLSTSSMRIRQPVIVDLDEQCSSTLTTFSSTSQLGTPGQYSRNRLTGGLPLSTLPESPKTPTLKRKRSSSVGSLSQTLLGEPSTPSKNLRPTPERIRHRSLERSLSVDRLDSGAESTYTMSLRDTPERSRFRSRESSQEPPSTLKKSASTLALTELNGLRTLGDGVQTVSTSALPSRKLKQFKVTPVKEADLLDSASAKLPELVKAELVYFTAPSSPVKILDEEPSSLGSVVPNSQEQSEIVLDSEEVVRSSQQSDIVTDSQDLVVPTSQQNSSFTPEEPCLKGILRSPSNKKIGRRVVFDKLDVFYFGRDQGFDVVPKHGEIALGMEYQHFGQRQFRVLKSKRNRISFEDSDESELSDEEEPGYNWQSNFEKSPIERIKLLEAAGIVLEKQKKINLLRQSRDQCGCSCRGGVCKPATCECSRLGIKCQVDGPRDNGSTYPCACYNADLCNNENGRDEYDYNRVTQARRAAIQRYKDSQKTGIYASPQVIKFVDEVEVVADSQELQRTEGVLDRSSDEFPVTPIYKIREVKVTAEAGPSNSTSFFPRSKSLL